MKVLRISHSDIVPAYRERARLLSTKFGVDLHLVIPKKWPHLGLAAGMEDREEPFQVSRLRTARTGSVPLFAFEWAALANVMKMFRPDVIDIHEEPYSVSGFQCAALARVCAPESACVFYSAQNIFKRYPPPFCFSEKFVYDWCQSAYPCSATVIEVLRRKGFDKALNVIPLGVDPSLFQPVPDAKAALGLLDEFVIGYAGRYESSKGIDDLIDAASKLRTAGRSFKLLMMGSGSYRDRLHARVQDLGLEANFVDAGEQRPEDMPRFLSACSALVVPSRTTTKWKEQFGRAVVEAMACGVPVIASNSGSLPEVVGDAGLIFHEGDTAALASQLERLLDDSTLRSALVSAGSERVARSYTWERVAEMMLSLYQQALELKQAQR